MEEKNEAKDEENTNKPRVFFVLGGPGSGKGTQCSKLVNEFGLIHLSAGDLLRKERNSGSQDAELINNYIKEGKIVPVKITVNLIKKAMLKYMDYGLNDFIIDGFPRNKDNLNGWNTIMGNFANVPFLLLLQCTEEEMTKRIIKRSNESRIKRKDDNLETLQKRFKVYNCDTMPIINEFIKLNKCKKVNSIGKINTIYNNIRKLFISILIKPKIIFVLGGPGSGKGTQCNKLINDIEFKLSFTHLSAGDLLRNERNLKTKNSELINNYIKEGKIVPVEITVNLIKNRIQKLINEQGKYVFIIDGFPRNYNNYNGWNKIMNNISVIEFLLLFECTQEEMTKRIIKRSNESRIKRKDDNLETLQKRFKVYNNDTLPIIKEFEKQNKLIKINSMNNIENIYLNIKPFFIPFIKKPNVIFVLGGPGSGKGTQCNKLVNEFGLIHLSAGDLLRNERNSGSKDAQLINNYIQQGKIVPVKITVNLIKIAMLKYMTQNNKYLFIIDGFPRNYDNLNGWNKICGPIFANVPFLLHLQCNENIMTNRILNRAKESTIKRKDDNIDTIKKRFKVYNESTMSVINIFRNEGKCIDVDASDTIQNVYAKVKHVFVGKLNL